MANTAELCSTKPRLELETVAGNLRCSVEQLDSAINSLSVAMETINNFKVPPLAADHVEGDDVIAYLRNINNHVCNLHTTITAMIDSMY